LRLSALDVCPVWEGDSPADALRASLRLARAVDELTYERFWVAEHHAVPNLATSTPTVLAAAVAAVAPRIRVGTGGVMLNNHSAFSVAEQFATLAALHPGRIDAGVGRAAGGNEHVARLLSGAGPRPEFDEQLRSLVQLVGPTATGALRPSPDADGSVPVFLLGARPSSARRAGQLGLAFAYAHDIRPAGVAEALAAYRESFRSDRGATPVAIVAARVVVAEDRERALALALPSVLGQLRSHTTGRVEPFPREPRTGEVEALHGTWREFIDDRMDGHVLGTPEEVRVQVDRLTDAGADELMALTMVPDEAARHRSYELLARAVTPAVPPPAAGAGTPD
jgi:luciferase family oxidoreductase group 1